MSWIICSPTLEFDVLTIKFHPNANIRCELVMRVVNSHLFRDGKAVYGQSQLQGLPKELYPFFMETLNSLGTIRFPLNSICDAIEVEESSYFHCINQLFMQNMVKS